MATQAYPFAYVSRCSEIVAPQWLNAVGSPLRAEKDGMSRKNKEKGSLQFSPRRLSGLKPPQQERREGQWHQGDLHRINGNWSYTRESEVCRN